MEDGISQDDFLAAFGVNQDSQDPQDPQDTQDTQDPQDANNQNNQTDPANPEGANPGSGDTTGEPAEDPKDGEQTGDSKDGQQNDNTSKSAQAFASMRVKLAHTEKLLNGVATVLGLDPKSKDSMDQLQTKLTEALAKKQGLPVETLQRLNKLEEMEEQRNIEQIRNSAFLGFQNVKTSFNLTDDELQDFANELVADGKNPFTQTFDLVAEYKLRNFDKLIEKAKADGVQSEIDRASKANNNATTPSKNTGGTANDTLDKVSSVKQLNEWFNKQTR